MAELTCPVCGTPIDVNSTTICTVCGFEYRIFSSPLPEDVDAIEKKRIEIAKRNYNSLSNCQKENEELRSQVNALNDQIALLKTELEENAVKETKVPFYLLQEDSRTGRHKLHHLEAGVHSFGGDLPARHGGRNGGCRRCCVRLSSHDRCVRPTDAVYYQGHLR